MNERNTGRQNIKAETTHVIYTIIVFLFLPGVGLSQNYEDQYREPLEGVLKSIESRYHVKLKYNAAVLKDRVVSYADWRFRSDLSSTLDNILTLNDLVYYRVSDTVYNIEPYQYWQKPVEEGRRQLDSFLIRYKTLPEWEKRKTDLRKCILATLGIPSLLPAPVAAPITTIERKHNGYAVQNIAIETLPGVYVCGSLYRPLNTKGKIPVILSPNGHFSGGRYRTDQQLLSATLARLGAAVFSYDLFGWGESRLQFKDADHYTSQAMIIQVVNNLRILDYLTALKDADTARVGITGASGGGSQTMLLTALSERIKVSVPVVMLSCYYAGGCPCETGIPVHFCGGGTNNAEIAAMAAPRPQLIISDGQDWTDHVPGIEFPYLQKIYGKYNQAGKVKNVHLVKEEHDYGFSKRKAMYLFMAEQLQLDIMRIKNAMGEVDESLSTVEDEPALYVFGDKGKKLPGNAIKGMNELKKVMEIWLK